jgi:murein DD-endopeptidase MepM/ murein hydrolase activator NlpD
LDRFLDEKVNKLAAFVVVVLLAGVVLLLLASRGTEMKFDPAVEFIGSATPVKVHAVNPHGLRRVTAQIEQNGVRYTVYQATHPSARLMFWRKKDPARVISFTAGKNEAPALKDGKARLIVEAKSNDFRGSTDSISTDVTVITQAPTISADTAQHYINQGGSELATFTPAGYWTEAGVRTSKYTFRSFPLPGRSGERFSLFAYPWDLPPDIAPFAYARNPAGAEAQARFWCKIFPKRFRVRDLDITDAFLEKVVNQIEPGGSGDLLTRFLKINGEMRRTNNQTLADLRNKTEERVLWNGPFIHLGQEESMFADVRNYIYKGKKVDQQVHLGFDLADRQGSPVIAANDGKVIWARNLGIYGNCIVVDHGYGLQSIYGHMSQFGVKEGDSVKKGQSMGKSGSTGLAGGDHVHFSMQVDGVQVTPVEWWDEHWIRDRILSKLNPQSAGASAQ